MASSLMWSNTAAVLPPVSATTLPNSRDLRLWRAPSLLVAKCCRFGHPKLRTMATTQSSSAEAALEKVRPLAHFEPDAWGDFFLGYTPENEDTRKKKEQEHTLLKDRLEKDLLKLREEPVEFLKLVDELERLGVAYHFHTIIEKNLERIYENEKACIQKMNNLAPYDAFLMFRILRQHRYNVKSSVLERFLDENENFLESLKEDIITMLCLYEAAYMQRRGEGILGNALAFTKNHLEVIAHEHPHHPLAAQIKRALKYPIQRGVIRLESRHYISFYEQNPSHNINLLRLAKLDFDLLQSLYKEELKEITRWMQRFNFAKKFSFARLRLVESHFFSMGTSYESKFSLNRKIYIKCFMVLIILDDIYDAYGTIDELEVFTQAIERWDRGCTLELPCYMKQYCEILYDVTKELEDEVVRLGRMNYFDYLRCEITKLAKAYLHGARWREAKFVPSYEEYIEGAIRLNDINLCTVLFSVVENEVEESSVRKTFDIFSNHEKSPHATNIIGRCLNDIADYEVDNQRDHVVGAVHCYMKRYGMSKEEACKAINLVVEDAWKDLNEELSQLSTTFNIPTTFLMRHHNLARACDYVYKYEDGYTLGNQRMKDTLRLLYVEPIFSTSRT